MLHVMEPVPVSIHSTRLFSFAAILILLSHTGVLALENLGLKLERLRSEIILKGFIFPMEKKIVGRLCVNEPKQRTGEHAGRIAQSQQPFWALGFYSDMRYRQSVPIAGLAPMYLPSEKAGGKQGAGREYMITAKRLKTQVELHEKVRDTEGCALNTPWGYKERLPRMGSLGLE